LTYRKTHNATILLASHNMLEVERLCDRVIIMKRGTRRGRRQPRQHHDALQPRHPGGSVSRRRARPGSGRARHERCWSAISRAGIAPHRINAMVLRYWYLLLSSWPRLLELIYWPALQIITWGFLQNYISQSRASSRKAGGTLIGAVILWDILFRGQLGFSISFLEEMWARNLGNLMMSP
jgi:energy-coupling factor transporter ATP-binding protein EcfA2